MHQCWLICIHNKYIYTWIYIHCLCMKRNALIRKGSMHHITVEYLLENHNLTWKYAFLAFNQRKRRLKSSFIYTPELYLCKYTEKLQFFYTQAEDETYSMRISGSTSVTLELFGKRFNCRLLYTSTKAQIIGSWILSLQHFSVTYHITMYFGQS